MLSALPFWWQCWCWCQCRCQYQCPCLPSYFPAVFWPCRGLVSRRTGFSVARRFLAALSASVLCRCTRYHFPPQTAKTEHWLETRPLADAGLLARRHTDTGGRWPIDHSPVRRRRPWRKCRGYVYQFYWHRQLDCTRHAASCSKQPETTKYQPHASFYLSDNFMRKGINWDTFYNKIFANMDGWILNVYQFIRLVWFIGNH